MKQSPLRKLRRDRARLVQELALAKGTGGKAEALEIEKRIGELDKQIAKLEASAGRGGA